jgi:hypothetical protein
MKTSTFTLIPSTTFGTAVENYNGISTTFNGVPEKAAGYYTSDKGMQTISWYLTNFTAQLLIEATLDADPATASFITVHTVGDSVTPLSDNNHINLEGNYTWIRATVIDFSAGSVIGKVSLGY